MLLGGTGIVLLVLGLGLTIQLLNQKSAHAWIQKAESARTQTLNLLREKKDFLSERSSYFKEKDRYERALAQKLAHFESLDSHIENLKTQEARNVIKAFKNGLLGTFQPDSATLQLMGEIQDAFDKQNYLIESWAQLILQKREIEAKRKEREDKYLEIQKNSPYLRVREQGKEKFGRVDSTFNAFVEAFDRNTHFQRTDIGSLAYVQILAQVKIADQIQNKYTDFEKSSRTLDQYYDLLTDQYYTKVIRQEVRSSLTYESEPNPAFREWTETESYTDTETYYESESYSSTCTETSYETQTTIVDGKAVTRSVPVSHSVPCTKTRQISKTRPVTRTRSITKNNGEARYVDVPYTTFTFYYLTERVDPRGKTQNEKRSGSIKLQGTAPSQPNYRYQSEEQIGYVIWKEKWNDQEQKGLLNPRIN